MNRLLVNRIIPRRAPDRPLVKGPTPAIGRPAARPTDPVANCDLGLPCWPKAAPTLVHRRSTLDHRLIR